LVKWNGLRSVDSGRPQQLTKVSIREKMKENRSAWEIRLGWESARRHSSFRDSLRRWYVDVERTKKTSVNSIESTIFRRNGTAQPWWCGARVLITEWWHDGVLYSLGFVNRLHGLSAPVDRRRSATACLPVPGRGLCQPLVDGGGSTTGTVGLGTWQSADSRRKRSACVVGSFVGDVTRFYVRLFVSACRFTMIAPHISSLFQAVNPASRV